MYYTLHFKNEFNSKLAEDNVLKIKKAHYMFCYVHNVLE